MPKLTVAEMIRRATRKARPVTQVVKAPPVPEDFVELDYVCSVRAERKGGDTRRTPRAAGAGR